MIKYTDTVNIFNFSNNNGAKMWIFDKIYGHGKLPDDDWYFKVI